MTQSAPDLRLSTSEIAPYAIDGIFLSTLRQEMIDLVVRVADKGTLSSTVEIVTMLDGQRTTIVDRETGPVIQLTDGTIPSPHAVEMTIGGTLEGSRAFVMQVHLSPSQSDFVFASGPAPAAHAGMDLMLRRLGERALRAPAPVDRPLRRSLRSPVLATSSLMLQIATILFATAGGWTTFTSIMLGTSGMMLSIYLLMSNEPETPAPKPLLRTLDLSRTISTSFPKLDHAPMEPLEMPAAR